MRKHVRCSRVKSLSQIKAVSFDGDMTLWDFDQVMRHSLSCALEELRRRLPALSASLTVDTMIAIREAVAADMRGTTDLEAIRLESFRRTLDSIGAPDEDIAVELNTVYLRHRFERVDLYPDALPLLDALAGHYSIGLISNGNGYPALGDLAGRFDFLVFSQDVGVEKPDPRIFHAACEAACCAPSELMHVGDSIASDVAGANAVGALSVWLNRDGVAPAADAVPHYEVRSLLEIEDLLVSAAHLTSASS
jgi:putative hydrolase of the HAD superfamily